MNATLPLTLARSMAAMAPPTSIVHKILADIKPEDIDRAMLADKLVDGYGQRARAAALRAQIRWQAYSQSGTP